MTESYLLTIAQGPRHAPQEDTSWRPLRWRGWHLLGQTDNTLHCEADIAEKLLDKQKSRSANRQDFGDCRALDAADAHPLFRHRYERLDASFHGRQPLR